MAKKSAPKKAAAKKSARKTGVRKKVAKKATPKKAAPKKAAPKKAASRTGVNANTGINVEMAAAAPAVASETTTVHVDFISGVGQMTASLFRNGLLINMQSTSSSGDILFSDTQINDVISINGICAGTAKLTISRDTLPPTPKSFPAGPFHQGFII